MTHQIHLAFEVSDEQAAILNSPNWVALVIPMIGGEVVPFGAKLNTLADAFAFFKRALATLHQALESGGDRDGRITEEGGGAPSRPGLGRASSRQVVGEADPGQHLMRVVVFGGCVEAGVVQGGRVEMRLTRVAGRAVGHLAAAERAEIAPDAGAGGVGHRHSLGPAPEPVGHAEERGEAGRGRPAAAFAMAMALPERLGIAFIAHRATEAAAAEGESEFGHGAQNAEPRVQGQVTRCWG